MIEVYRQFIIILINQKRIYSVHTIVYHRNADVYNKYYLLYNSIRQTQSPSLRY